MILGAAMLVSAVSCQKGLDNNKGNELVTPGVEPEEFALYAEIPETKTTLQEGFKVVWNKNDQIAVFNAPTGTSSYSSNLHFYIDEEATGKFTPGEGVDVPFEDNVNYDWFVCSPYRSTGGSPELVTPVGQAKADGYFPIGAATQTGYNNSVHVASSDIMVGKALDTRTPVVTLKHLAVLHKFTVTNNSDKPTVITKLTFNGGDNKLFGTFWIDMTSDNPAIDADKANATFAERALTVADGEELAVGASADFYVMTAPFTLNAGETFKITIETTTGNQVVEKTASADIEFAAGTYNTANLVYDYVYTPVYADHLYEDTFNGTFSGSANVTTSNSTFTPARWDSYDKAGMTVYDGDVASVTYAHDSNSTISKYANSALTGMDDFYVWFKQGGVLTVSGIKLHGYTDLSLSFLQTYKSATLKVEYNVGADWVELGSVTNPASVTCETRTFDFTVPSSSQTINLRFTATTSAPRIDNVKLTWQTK